MNTRVGHTRLHFAKSRMLSPWLEYSKLINYSRIFNLDMVIVETIITVIVKFR